MMEAIEQAINSTAVRDFVFTHPYVTWGLLTLFFSLCIGAPLRLIPVKRNKP